jgi:hypothetical protein
MDRADAVSSADRLVDDFEALCQEPEPPLHPVSQADAAKNRFRFEQFFERCDSRDKWHRRGVGRAQVGVFRLFFP